MDKPVGIGGWLFLVAAGLALAGFQLIDALSATETPFEVLFLLAIAGYWAYVGYCFLNKKRTFPLHMRNWLIGALVLAALVMLLEPGPENTRLLVSSGIGTAIWVSYLRKSERVRNTFVN